MRAASTLATHDTALRAGILLALVLAAIPARADVTTTTAPPSTLSNPFAAFSPVSANAKLRFNVSLGSFVSLRVGSAGSTINSVSFDLTSLTTTCTAAPPCAFGDGTPVATMYDGGFGASGLPIEVKSNAGAIKLAASVSAPLTSLGNGGSTLPFSQIKITSSDTANLPAPQVPDSGSGAPVSVAEISAGNRITQRTANWTFSYANTVVPAAGTYTGGVTFTASSP